MAQNFPGPFELRITYTTTPTALPTLTHVQRLNINLTDPDPTPGTTFDNLNVYKNGGVVFGALDLAVEEYLGLLKPLLNTSSDIGPVELWKYAPLSFDATFISAYAPTNNVGTGVPAANPAGQSMITFRTTEGGIMKLNIMESATYIGVFQSFPTNEPNINALANWVTGLGGFILGRDTSYPLAVLRWLPGQNEKLFKKRFR